MNAGLLKYLKVAAQISQEEEAVQRKKEATENHGWMNREQRIATDPWTRTRLHIFSVRPIQVATTRLLVAWR